MDDRVAKVLVERAALSSGPSSGLVASAFLHAAFIAAVVTFVRSNPGSSPQQTIITMRLAGPAKVSSAPRFERPNAVKPVPVSRPAAVTPPVVAQAKPVKKNVDASLFGRSRDPESHLPLALPPRAPNVAQTGLTPAVGTAGVTGIEGGDFPYATYIDRMVALIGTHWLRPQLTGTPMVRLYFVVQRDGTIQSDTRIEQPSGNDTFDRAALRAVIEASPLPPLPFAYQGQFIGVHLTFH